MSRRTLLSTAILFMATYKCRDCQWRVQSIGTLTLKKHPGNWTVSPFIHHLITTCTPPTCHHPSQGAHIYSHPGSNSSLQSGYMHGYMRTPPESPLLSGRQQHRQLCNTSFPYVGNVISLFRPSIHSFCLFCLQFIFAGNKSIQKNDWLINGEHMRIWWWTKWLGTFLGIA